MWVQLSYYTVLITNEGKQITTINVGVNIRENAKKKSMLLILQFIIDGGSQPNL